ncbi:MAG: alpha/beta hydrolase [Desulfosporosinus sp. BRH_c37]|nr:MAG: alpha/beta hydrolase [Desulfosporosinus sp. BRH_c37]
MNVQTFHPYRSEKAQQEYLEYYDKKAKIWPVPSHTEFIETSYGHTFVRISGPDNAPPLVLLPGLNYDSMSSWYHNIEALSTKYRTYAIDNIYDCGRSVYSRLLTNLDDFVNWLDELFNELEFENKINLMGLSFGACLTAQYILRFPERINKAIMIAPAGTILPLSSKLILRMILTIIPLKYCLKSFMFWLLKDWVTKSDTDRESCENLIQEFFLTRKCFKPKRLIQPTVLKDEQLQNIRVPMFYMVGENEKMYSAQEAVERLNKIAPQIKTEIILNSGHDLAFSQAEIVNSKILEFLQS